MKYIHLVGGSVEEFAGKFSVYEDAENVVSVDFG